MKSFTPRIAVVPVAPEGVVEAVEDGGGRLSGAADADGIVWTHPLDAESLKRTLADSPARWVQLPFAGIEEFVAAGAIDPERTWTCAKGVYGHATAEHAVALMLAAARRLHRHVRARTWSAPGFGSLERRLHGSTVVVVGTGGIGRELAKMLEPFRASLVAVNRSGTALAGAQRTATIEALPGLLPDADFVVLAAALTRETRGLFDRDMLECMREGAWLVNVARGGLVNTQHLVEVLQQGLIGGAALDVTDPEPLPEDHPLWSMDDVIITPHVANTWEMGLPELTALVRRNVARFAAGDELEGRVNPDLGY